MFVLLLLALPLLALADRTRTTLTVNLTAVNCMPDRAMQGGRLVVYEFDYLESEQTSCDCDIRKGPCECKVTDRDDDMFSDGLVEFGMMLISSECHGKKIRCISFGAQVVGVDRLVTVKYRFAKEDPDEDVVLVNGLPVYKFGACTGIEQYV